MMPYVVRLCARAKWLSSVLEFGEEPRQGLDPLPAFALAHGLDAKIEEIAVEHGGPFFGQGRTAIILSLPDGGPVAPLAGGLGGTRQRRTARAEAGELMALAPGGKVFHQFLPWHRRNEIKRHPLSSPAARAIFIASTPSRSHQVPGISAGWSQQGHNSG